MRFQVGQKVGDYEFLAVVEATPTGVTYRVQNLLADRQELLKVLPPDLQEDQERIDRFLREAKIHARLHHPNIAAFYNATRVDGQLVMTSELVEGASLEQRIGSGSLPIEQAAKYFEQALSALSYAHREGVVHRDLKPGHLIITPDDSVKITGFGLAKKATDPQLTQPGIVMGSVHYMSPEQVKGSTELDRRSDIYSLGVVLYEAVTGQKPFDSKSQFEVFLAHVNQEPAPPSSVQAGIPPALDQIILTAMAKLPASRFQTAEEFRDSLGKLHGVLRDPVVSAGTAAAQPEESGAVAGEEAAGHDAVAPLERASNRELQSDVEPESVGEPESAAEPQPVSEATPSWRTPPPETAEPSGETPAAPSGLLDAASREQRAAVPYHEQFEAVPHQPFAAGPYERPPATPRSEPAAQADWHSEPAHQEAHPTRKEQQSQTDWSYSDNGQADWSYSDEGPAAAAEDSGDGPARHSNDEPSQGGWESAGGLPRAGADEAGQKSPSSWASQTGGSHGQTETAAWSASPDTGWGQRQPESHDASAPRAADDAWPEAESFEEHKGIPLLLRPSGDAGAPRYSPAAQAQPREAEESAGSWFGEQAFAGWTSKDILAVGALTFVIVAAVFFALLTFLNR